MNKNKIPKLNESKYNVSEPMQLFDFLKVAMPNKKRTEIKTILTHRCVWLNNKRIITQYNYMLQPGDEVVIKISKGKQYSFYHPKVKILFEDDYLIVIEKREGLLSVGTEKDKKNTAYNILNEYMKSHNPESRIFVVHRLDRETSGVMLFAKSEKIQKALQHHWNDAVIERTYMAVVEGCPKNDEDIISSYLIEDKSTKMHSLNHGNQGQKAVTAYKVLQKNDQYSLLKLNLQTGRKNQIRVHLESIGCPVVGDLKYGASQNPMGRLGLHALNITFLHPITKSEMTFEMRLPAIFKSLVNA